MKKKYEKPRRVTPRRKTAPHVTGNKHLLMGRFYRLIEEHKNAVSKSRLSKLSRELNDTAGLLQSMSRDWDI